MSDTSPDRESSPRGELFLCDAEALRRSIVAGVAPIVERAVDERDRLATEAARFSLRLLRALRAT